MVATLPSFTINVNFLTTKESIDEVKNVNDILITTQKRY